MTEDQAPLEGEVVEETALVQPPQEQRALTPPEMLSLAVQQNADTDKLEKLMDLQERYEANEARKAYIQAMTIFRSKCPTIKHNKQGHTNTYADLPGTVEQILPLLAECQLATTWNILTDERDWIKVECVVSHIGNHCERTALGGPPDTGPGRNALQARKSTWTYLRRVTLFSLLGLVDKAEVDDDGDGGAPAPEKPKPKSTPATSAEEDAKAKFTEVCQRLTGLKSLSNPYLKNIMMQTQVLAGSKGGVACTNWLSEHGSITDGVVSAKDGIGQADAKEDEGVTDGTEAEPALSGIRAEKCPVKCDCGAEFTSDNLIKSADGLQCPECGSWTWERVKAN